MMLEEIAVIVALFGPLAAGNQLHRGIDEEGIDQSFEFEFSGLSGVVMLGLDSVEVYPCQRAGQSADRNIGMA